MKSLDQFILEAIDRPVRWKWHSYTRELADVLFTTSKGRKIYVEITLNEDYDNYSYYDAAFSDDEGWEGIRNVGDQLETLATVMNIIETWVMKQKNPVVLGVAGADKRGRVYHRMVGQLTTKITSKHSIWVVEKSRETQIYIVNRHVEKDFLKMYKSLYDYTPTKVK